MTKVQILALLIFTQFLPTVLRARFSKKFLWGCAIAEFQNSGATRLPKSNWATFEHEKNKSRTDNALAMHTSGNAVNHWDKYKEDIALIKRMGMNTFRFSIDWSAIQPDGPGSYNQEAIKHYHDLCTALVAANITPMATLHHFVHPQWFDNIGGFEKEENIKHFVTFSKKVFQEYARYIPLWCTINEPAVHGYVGYLLGMHSPGKSMQITMAAEVIKNLLKSHVEVYKALKKTRCAGASRAQIGLVHNLLTFTTYRSYLNPTMIALAKIFTYYANDLVMNFLRTGIFDHNPTCGFGRVLYYDVNIDKHNDFIGLNYYAGCILGPLGTTSLPGQVMGDMDLPVDPQGFGEALEQMAELGLPVYVTEVGMCDNNGHDDKRRQKMLAQYCDVMHEKAKTIDLRGAYFWTLMDNFEWDRGWKAQFGLFDRNRQPKDSSYVLANLIQNYQSEAYTPLLTATSKN